MPPCGFVFVSWGLIAASSACVNTCARSKWVHVRQKTGFYIHKKAGMHFKTPLSMFKVCCIAEFSINKRSLKMNDRASNFVKYLSCLCFLPAEPGFQWLSFKAGQRGLPWGSSPPPHLSCHPNHPSAPGTLCHQLFQPAHTLPLPHASCWAHTEAQLWQVLHPYRLRYTLDLLNSLILFLF